MKRNKKKKNKLFLRILIEITRFIMHYIFPLLLLLIAVVLSIFIPYGYYYDGNYFIIRRACYTVIPLLVLSVFSVIIIIKKWLSVLRNYQIIK